MISPLNIVATWRVLIGVSFSWDHHGLLVARVAIVRNVARDQYR
jgi:hypothetical protein